MTATIRHARPADVHEIERLVRSDAAATFDAGELYGHGHLLVLDLGDGRLGGVAHLDVSDDRARLDLLVVEEARAQADEDRLRDVAHALGEAYGCRHVETVPMERATGAHGTTEPLRPQRRRSFVVVETERLEPPP